VVIGLRQAKYIMAEGDIPSGGKRAPFFFLLSVIGFITYALYNTALIPDYAATDRVFPVFVAFVSLIGAMILLVQMMLVSEKHTIFADREHCGEDRSAAYGLWPTLAWFAGLLFMTSLVGFILALVVFLTAFMRLRAGLKWMQALLLSAAGLAFILAMAWVLNRDFPPGLLQSYFDLPWPFT
jgi:putative tricarboxylic transport membrane protein